MTGGEDCRHWYVMREGIVLVRWMAGVLLRTASLLDV